MEPDGSDTNLLFGILAVKMNFIAKEDLFEAMGIWFLDRRKTLGEILVERDVLTPKNCELLDTMVRESQARAASGGGSRDRPEVPTRASEPIRPAEAPREPEELPGSLDPSERIDPADRAPLGRLGPAPGGRRRARPRRGHRHLAVAPGDRRDERFLVLRPHAKGGLGKVSVALDVS